MATTVTVNLSTYYSIEDAYETIKASDYAAETDIAAALEVLKSALAEIDTNNSLTRRYLYVRWYDLATNPANYDSYPPLESALLHSYSAFTQDIVEAFVEGQTSNSANIQVTDDPSGTVGWTEIATFFS